jgi:hypothetical protein
VLYERDSTPAYARVLPASAKLGEEQVVPTLVDPRFDVSSVALLPDTSSATSPAAEPPFRVSSVTAEVTEWSAGRMRIVLTGAEAAASHLLVSENWYPDWRATVDGAPAVVRRTDHSLLGVDLPAGARDVRLWFDSPTYTRGRLISLVSLLSAAAMVVAPVISARRGAARER